VKEGSVILASFPQADRKIKLRPAVILKIIPPFDDYLVCAISSQIHNYVEGLDILIDESHVDFNYWGLPNAGIVRSGMITMISTEIIKGRIGELSKETYLQVVDQLIKFLRN